jgi:signal transduction histidine kinase/DNA-binding NarL/FixJ family response regulator
MMKESSPVVALIAEPHHREAQALADCFDRLPEVKIDVIIYADIPQLLQSLLQRKANVVFIDASFLDSDQEVIAHIREVCRDCSIIVMTKEQNEAASLDMMRLEVDEYLVKGSFTPAELIMSMHRAILVNTLKTGYNQAIDLKRAAEQELVEQNSYNTVRTEIWNLAAERNITREDLILKFLSSVGTILGLCRASYFGINDEKTFAICDLQWQKPGVASTKGEKIPFDICDYFYKNSGMAIVKLSEQTIFGDYGPLVGSFLRKNNIKSFLGLPLDNGKESIRGFFDFVDCFNERQWKEKEIQFLQEMLQILTSRISQLNTDEERTMLQEELLVSRKMEAIGQLAGGVAHDFNNILGAISGYAEMIRHKFSKDNPKLERYCSTIISATRKAADLTAQLLTFARKGQYRMAACDIHDLINQTIALFKHSLNANITLNYDFKAKETSILGDKTQLQAALLNIAMNARDAMPEGGNLTFSTDTVTFDESYKKTNEAVVCGDYIIVSITDTGIGMDDSVKIKVFEPFFSTKDSGRGSGLNLAGVFGTIKAHKGYCAVSSEPGRGSTFKLYFPIAKTKRTENNGDVKQYPETTDKHKILIVDDEELMRSIFQEMLSTLGYGVELCNSGKEAVELYKKNFSVIDLVILDMAMSELTGIECFRELKKINPSVKAILSSGYDLNQRKDEIAAEKFTGVLQKPFETQMLANIVAEALSR